MAGYSGEVTEPAQGCAFGVEPELIKSLNYLEFLEHVHMDEIEEHEEPEIQELTGELDFIDPYIDEVQWERNYDY